MNVYIRGYLLNREDHIRECYQHISHNAEQEGDPTRVLSTQVVRSQWLYESTISECPCMGS